MSISSHNESRLNIVTSLYNKFKLWLILLCPHSDPTALKHSIKTRLLSATYNCMPLVICILMPSLVLCSVSEVRGRGFRSSEPTVILWNKRVDGQSHLSSFWWSLCHLTRCPPEASSDSRLQSANKQSDHLKHHTGWQGGRTRQLNISLSSSSIFRHKKKERKWIHTDGNRNYAHKNTD